MSKITDVVSLARALGFTIDQDADDETGELFWRWLAKNGLADAFELAGKDTEEFGFNTAEDAAKQAIGGLADALRPAMEGVS